MKQSCLRLLCGPLIALLALASLAFGQLGNSGTITGIVTDSTGASVPSAKVTAINPATGIKTTVTSDQVGNYSTPALNLGTYTLQVEKEGFKTYVREGIILNMGSVYRQDVQLELGSVTQTVEVKAASLMLNTQNAEVSHTISEKYYTDLPAVMGADIRLAESLLQVQPGYIPMAPNGDAIFRGSQFQSRINGGQTMSTENWFDGAAFGYAEGHQQTQESSLPYDSVREMKVLENNFSAQYGHTSGGIIQYTTKSGTNQFHGDVYDYLVSGNTNARVFFLPDVLPLTQNNWGFSLGGPVIIPKVYNGHDKMFFFVNLDGLDYHSIVNTGYVNTLPLTPQREGDFSAFLGPQLQVCGSGNNQPCVDALNRPIYQGEIYNPLTTRTVNGVVVRDGFGFNPVTGLPITGQANMIPISMFSPVSAKIIPLIAQPDRQALVNNGYGGTSDDNNKINVRTWLLRWDYAFKDKFKLSNTYYSNHRPRTAHCGGPGGCNTQYDGELQSDKNDTYFGQGFYQLITNEYEHLNFDWVMKPNIFNHATVAYDRWSMSGHSLSGGVGWLTKLGITGPINNTGGPPTINFQGNTPYTTVGNGWDNGVDVNNRWQFLDDVTWIKGKHSVKAGFEYRNMNFPQQGWAVNTTGTFNFNQIATSGYAANLNGAALSQTGDAFASFELGNVNDANFNVPVYDRPQQHYVALWANDDIKVTPKLTLTVGLRFDYQSGLSEQFNRFSNMAPNVPNPGAGGYPGAMIFANNNLRTFEDPGWNVGPRFGFAYQVKPTTVVRGGYGIYYSGVAASQFTAFPDIGFRTNPTAANVTSGVYPAFYWGDCASYGPGQVPCQFPQSDVILPPQITPTVANGTSPIRVAPDGATMPRYQNWSISIQHQFGSNMALDVAYVGDHGTRLINNWSTVGPAANMNPPSVLTTYGAALLQDSASSPQAQAAGIKLPYPGFVGNVAQALRLYPQYQNIIFRNVPTGMSSYNALQASFQKRMSHGLQFRVSYTWSKLINNGAEAGQSGQIGGQFGEGGIQNPVDLNAERSLSVDNVPNYFAVIWVYELPFGQGKKWGGSASGAVNALIGGWQVSATQFYQSGRPLGVTMTNTLSPYLFNISKRPDKVGPGVNTNFQNPQTPYLLTSGWSDPGTLNFGNAARTGVSGFAYYNEDLNIFKDTRLGEHANMRMEFMAGNVFNRVDFCNPNLNWSSPGFGYVNAQCNIPRRMQFGLSIQF